MLNQCWADVVDDGPILDLCVVFARDMPPEYYLHLHCDVNSLHDSQLKVYYTDSVHTISKVVNQEVIVSDPIIISSRISYFNNTETVL